MLDGNRSASLFVFGANRQMQRIVYFIAFPPTFGMSQLGYGAGLQINSKGERAKLNSCENGNPTEGLGCPRDCDRGLQQLIKRTPVAK